MKNKILITLLLIEPFLPPLNAVIICYQNITIYEEDRFVSKPQFCYDDHAGIIVDPAKIGGKELRDGRKKTIIPGFIDPQLNGAFGHDFTKNPASVLTVARQIGRYGVVAFSPTIISSFRETYDLANRQIHPGKTNLGAEVLKVHCEGPFINRLGTHSEKAVKFYKKGSLEELSVNEIESRYGHILDKTAIITLAPGQQGISKVIKHLSDKGIIVSLGHTDATFDDAIAALDQGASFFTHLFNTMSPLHHREPGLPLAALVGETTTKTLPYYGMIVDGIHVHPDMIKLAFSANPNLVLTPDGMAGLGLLVGQVINIGDQEVHIIEHLLPQRAKAKKAVLAKNGQIVTTAQGIVLAGSVISMIDSINLLVLYYFYREIIFSDATKFIIYKRCIQAFNV